MKYRNILFISLIGLLFACQPELEDFSTSSGDADFSNYISVGNSLTAGYSDGSLYRSAQMNSYPGILAQQFAKVGGGEFVQPLMDGEYGILPGKKKLDYYSNDCSQGMGPVDDIGTLDPIGINIGYTVNNLGVPGAKTFHLLAEGYGNPAGLPLGLANPYYVRFAQDPENSSVLTDAMTMNPTFFSLWIGSNDVLGYATTGGIGDSITEQNMFTYAINEITAALSANGTKKGVIANLPGIMGAPFFTTIPFNGLVLADQAQVDGLNAAYAPLGITFTLGQNPFIISDTSAIGGLRQIKENEMVLLTTPQDSIKCAGWGSMIPIPDQYTLSESEIANINTAVEVYNAIIEAMAIQYNLAFVDVYNYFEEVQSGVVYNGETFTVEYVTGGTFSLDGIHLSQKGYALIANKFIEAINDKYNATIPIVSATDYPGIKFP